MASSKLALRRELTGTASGDRAQLTAVATAQKLNQLAIPPDAYISRSVSIGASSTGTVVPHKLGRAFTQWMICRIRSGQAYGVTEGTQASALDSTQLTLRNDAPTAGPACVVDVLVW